MLKVCRFKPVPVELGEGVQEVYLPPPLIFCHKIQTAIDFSQNLSTFNFYGQLKDDMRSLRYVSRCFVEGR